MTRYESNIIPDNGERLEVNFRLTVLCVEMDESQGLLKTFGWKYMVRKAKYSEL